MLFKKLPLLFVKRALQAEPDNPQTDINSVWQTIIFILERTSLVCIIKSVFDSLVLNTPFICVDSFVICFISPAQLCIVFCFSSHACNNPSSFFLHPVYFYIHLKTTSSRIIENQIFYDSCQRQGLTSFIFFQF